MIKKRNIVISLILINILILSMSVVCASNETEINDIYSASLDDSLAIDNNNSFIESVTPKTIEITQNNYDNYFNQYTGYIKNTAGINDGDTLKIGNISNRAFVIDRQLTLIPISTNDQISNGFIHFVKGSDGSTVSNLSIINTKGILSINTQDIGSLHGIWLSDTNNITIAYNFIRIANSGGVYSIPIHNSNNNRIIYNDMSTWISSNIIMSDSSYNLISHNKIEVLSYSDVSVTNLIYFSPFGFAGRTGSALCEGNNITYNELIGFCNLPMSIIIQGIHANNKNTIVAHNTVYKGSYGINIVGDNSLVYNNTVNNSAIGINLHGNNASVVNNDVFGASQKTGIMISGGESLDAVAKGNNITFTDVSEALYVGNNAEVYNNIVNVANYGVGVRVSSNKSYIHNNKIRTSGDDAVAFLASNMLLDNNIIITNSKGVSISTSGVNRYYNNTISNNKITSDSYGIYLSGLVYNTTISSNIIETNATVGVFKDISDEESDSGSDNIINGVVYDSTALIIDDGNFYEYFDENGCFNYTFEKGKSHTVFLTFISNKNLIFEDRINVISNKMDNLLYNVTITFKGDASGSLIRDFNFMNFNKEAIILNDVSDVNVGFNNITTISDKKINSAIAVYVVGVGNDNIISGNNIYINSKSNYAYGISISSYNPYTYLYNKEFSYGFTISNNNIILITSGMAEAIFSDSIVESDVVGNTINIISDSDAYGIAAVNVIGRLYGWNVSANEIVIHSKKMAYLIENHMSNGMVIENNYFYSESNGVYGIATYMSENISINNNAFDIISGNLSNVEYDLDVIKPGNAAIYFASKNDLINITGNTFHIDVVPIKSDDSGLINISSNYHVIDDENYLVYFHDDLIDSSIVKCGDTLLLANLTKYSILNIDVPVYITNYKGFNSSVSIVLSQGSDNSSIFSMSFVNSSIALNNVSNIHIVNNTFDSGNDVISIVESFGNYLINNTFNNGLNVVEIDNSHSNFIEYNRFNVNESNNVKVITINNSHDISVENNNFTGVANDLVFIGAFNSFDNNIVDNAMIGNASDIFGIYLSNSSHINIELNNIRLKGNSAITNQAAVYIADNSAYNDIAQNFIVTYSKNADDFAVIILSDEILSNNVRFNYLISSNGSKRANDAVLSNYLIEDNTPCEIYVSDDGSDISGDGSESNPFATLSYALKNSLNHAVIKLMKGTFIESNLNIDKNITIIALSPNVILNANNNQLFNITKRGILSIDGISIKNGFNENGGSLFINKGTLIINNSNLFNSSSYYDNSNPEFVAVDESHWESHDCSDSGMGGAILNYGTLVINNSLIHDNFAHIGGAIADFGKTVINSSVIYSNQAVHGGAIFTDSKYPLSINNSLFLDNMAIISMDYCTIRKSASSWSIEDGYRYSYNPICNLQTGTGGAIYTLTTDLNIDNSVFNHNMAWKGGAIATKYVSSSSSTKLDVDLIVNNSSFINNRVNNQTKKISSSLMDSYQYNSGYDGGAIYGAFNQFSAYNSNFTDNQAQNDGGALYVQSSNGVIDLCNFLDNRAGLSAGALFISNNFLITRSIISNNSAMYGGAITYQSYSYYDHVQDNLNIYNSTISNNFALESGGAMRVGQSNITIRNSNIYDNFAPTGSTMSSAYITSDPKRVSADVRNNWWGVDSMGKAKTADDSVYNFPNVQTGRKSNTKFSWITDDNDDAKDVNPVIPVNPDTPGSNNPIPSVNPVNTGSSTHTGGQIGRFSGGSGGGTVNGPSGIPGTSGGSGNGGSFNPLNGNSESSDSSNTISNVVPGVISIPTSDTSAENVNNNAAMQDLMDYIRSNTNSSRGSSDNMANRTSNENSMSSQNSTTYDEALTTVGLTANAMATSDSSAGSSSSASADSSSSDSSKAYELDENTKKQIDDGISTVAFVAIAVIILLLLIVGYKRRENDEEEY